MCFSAVVSCGKNSNAPTTNPTSDVHTIASLVPAATDLLIGMGARDHLVAVSTYDRQRPDVDNLPKVGDYQTVDWEALGALHPQTMVIQMKVDRLPGGFTSRADAIHANLVNVSIDRLADIYDAIDTLGTAAGMPEAAMVAKRKMQLQLESVRRRVADAKPVSVLLVISDSGDGVVGPDNYLDDLLQLAGGVNAAAGLGQRYPQVDREMLVSLKPDVIIELLPDATAQVKEKAAATWSQLPQIPAVANGRVYVIDNWYALLPGWHVTDLAKRFAECLHPLKPSSQATTSQTQP